ncbi:hypothetical protein B0H67DRAFT_684217 [Lasiosphaeris hirsuta]|uniref:DUF4470 domain-containing protein n=1 Tax=Lasiosphaeris hirsuta TaxID=260670 RepID=A0AA40DX13_9PEZI|nr:hypothetical protein B0H67DRAFT_684217 [Lasiosphaeris hirsuta]
MAYFYPVGNTPAVSLTQGLPHEKRADLLLLGCGDIRHILFTAHCDPARQLDTTCRDSTKAVIARNILLLSLILDDTKSANPLLWDLYYHFRVDKASLNLLEAQARKLCTLSTSLQAWHQSEYGQRIRLCGQGSLAAVREMWSFYAKSAAHPDLFDAESNMRIQAAREDRSNPFRGTTPPSNLTVLRSTAPTTLMTGEDLSLEYTRYWQRGTTYRGKDAALHGNPMFHPLDSNVHLHYATDPLLGFHLATTYAPLDATQTTSAVSPSQPSTPAEGARAEFQSWILSLRKAAKPAVLRFFIGDALAFSHFLQHKNRLGNTRPAHWHRAWFDFEPLVLDTNDYAENGPAPRVFDVIDTSNLIDYVGAIGVLAATSPLLKNDAPATIFTENLIRESKTHKELMDNLLFGDLQTVSTLLGLVPVEVVTNTSPSCTRDETIILAIISAGKDQREAAPTSRQLFSRIPWKRPIMLNKGSGRLQLGVILRFSSTDLANVLHSVYTKMFENQKPTTASKLNAGTRDNRSNFAAFLRLVKTQVKGDWRETMETLIGFIQARATQGSQMAENDYTEEVCT